MGLLNIGISGLQVSQTQLQITGNNIANADQPEYSRQRAEVATRIEQLQGPGYIGSGSYVNDIARVVDEFVIAQLRADSSQYSSLQTYTRNIEAIDSLLADDLGGLGPAIGDFFAALEASAQDPTSEPARQVVLSQAESLAQRFITLDQRIRDQNQSINEQLASQTKQITTLADGIADLNKAITEAIGRGAGAQPNQLLDERDQLLLELSQLVSVQAIDQSNGAVNVFIGNGQPLVVGNTAGTLETRASDDRPGDEDIVFIGFNNAPQDVTSLVSGGSLGGLLQFQQEVVSETLNSMGRLAIAISNTLNRQNQIGIDLEGNLGSNIFSDINTGQQIFERISPDADNPNSSTQVLSVSINNVATLTTSDYQLRVYDAGNGGNEDYQLIRSSDGAVVSSGEFTNPGGVGDTITTGQGFSIDIDGASAALQFGDNFIVQPTRNGASNIELEMTRVQELAYGLPIVSDADIGNTGTGAISSGEVIEILDGAGEPFENPGSLQPPILIRFTSATDYQVFDNSDPASLGAPLFSGTIIPGQENEIFPNIPGPQYTGYQVSISGAPAAGDEFTVNYNSNGSSDNRNALAMGQLRQTDILDGGQTNFENGYGSLVEKLGTRTAQFQTSASASLALVEQSQASRDSLSGVNLDEEATNLIKFEQAYNASAQIIAVARSIFDTLIATFR